MPGDTCQQYFGHNILYIILILPGPPGLCSRTVPVIGGCVPPRMSRQRTATSIWPCLHLGCRTPSKKRIAVGPGGWRVFVFACLRNFTIDHALFRRATPVLLASTTTSIIKHMISLLPMRTLRRRKGGVKAASNTEPTVLVFYNSICECTNRRNTRAAGSEVEAR